MGPEKGWPKVVNGDGPKKPKGSEKLCLGEQGRLGIFILIGSHLKVKRCNQCQKLNLYYLRMRLIEENLLLTLQLHPAVIVVCK